MTMNSEIPFIPTLKMKMIWKKRKERRRSDKIIINRKRTVKTDLTGRTFECLVQSPKRITLTLGRIKVYSK